MGLKGYRLWVMGQLDSTCRAPPREPAAAAAAAAVVEALAAAAVAVAAQPKAAGCADRDVALQVEI
jgi:hypothetical protein